MSALNGGPELSEMSDPQPHSVSTLCVKARRLATVKAVAVVSAVGFAAVLGWSAATAFERDTEPVALAATEPTTPRPLLGQRPAPVIEMHTPARQFVEVKPVDRAAVTPSVAPAKRIAQPGTRTAALPANVKYNRAGYPIMVNGKPWTGEVFDYKPIRPVKTRKMKTTAYSPDHRSCGEWADGITASGKSVWMNGGKLVAADRKIPYGTILTIPGYNNEKPVQVWDRGGAIKGNRLDLLHPTHKVALQWGVQDLDVVFWQFVKTDD